jgi:ribosomal protein S18 acetylase RimI-like enzyme
MSALEFREVRSADTNPLSAEAAHLLNSGRLAIWTCLDDTSQVGHCEGDRVTGEIIGLAVQPGYRRRGVGTQLLQRVVDSLRAAGAKRIWLDAPNDATIPAHGFYRALGWRATGQLTGEHPDFGEILELPDDRELDD